MLARAQSVALLGTEARLVDVEVFVSNQGLPGFSIVGLPTASVREAIHRTKAAIVAIKATWPGHRIVANLAPGAVRKEGTHFDLALALGILAGAGAVPIEQMDGWVTVGELGLDGEVRAVRGTLAAAMCVKESGRRGLICPAGNAAEAALVEGIDVVPVGSLRDCLQFLAGDWVPPVIGPPTAERVRTFGNLSDVHGHRTPKRALEIAAAGGHNLLLSGPPGSGKTMLAQRLPQILPAMSVDESLEVTRIYSIAGLLEETSGLITSRPFRLPHHHLSLAGLIGGGSGLARPGEVSLAHHGVLFLDEISLYRKEVLESLRSPLEDGVVRIARSGGSIAFPCRFSLIAAMNPCACGFYGDSRVECRCSPLSLEQYGNKLSGPLLDRFDMQSLMSRLSKKELMGPADGEDSETIRQRVESARAIQHDRYGSCLLTNASIAQDVVQRHTVIGGSSRRLLEEAVESNSLTGRGLSRVFRVARTIADLAGCERINEEHIGEALSFRLDRLTVGVAA